MQAATAAKVARVEATVDGLSGDVKRLDAKLDLLLARLGAAAPPAAAKLPRVTQTKLHAEVFE